MKENQDNYIKNIDLIKPQKLELKPIHMNIKINEAKIKNFTFDKLKELQNSIYYNTSTLFYQLKRLKSKNLNIIINPSEILKNNFLAFFKKHFSEDILNQFKNYIDPIIFETFENSLSVSKKNLKTDDKLSLNEKIQFIVNTGNNLYYSLENKLSTTKGKNLLENIRENMDFGYINLEDYRSTKAINFFKLLEKSGLNLINDKKNYILLKIMLTNFLLIYNKFYEIYDIAKEIKQSKCKDILYNKNYQYYSPDKIFYMMSNIPFYNKSKYKLIINIINIISHQFIKINTTEDLISLFSYLIVKENTKQTTISYAKKQLINSTPDKDFTNFLISFKH
jgi:hypothetical protein